MARSSRSLACAGVAAISALAWIARTWAEATAQPPSMDAVPLLQQALDRPPPRDAFESAVLQNQFELLGFKAAADKLDGYLRLRLLSSVMPLPSAGVATLREVTTGASPEPALHAAVARITTDGVSVAFPATGDEGAAPQLQASQQGLEHVERLAQGLWGVFKPGQADRTAARAEAFYLAADLHNRLAAKADIQVQYELQPGLLLSCAAAGVPAGGHRGALCEARLVGKVSQREGSRWMALTAEQKTAVFDRLLALRQAGAPVPQALHVHLGESHLSVDSAAGATLDATWRAAAASEARQRLQAASCDALGTCAIVLAQQATSPAAIHAGLTLLVMGCLLAYRFHRGGGRRLWPTLAKLYVLLFALAIVINVADRPAGVTRGAPLSGTLGFMAKVAVSMPWSYYVVSGAPDSGPRPGVPARTLADDSPWFWGFAGVNLVFVLLMAAGGDGRKRNVGA